MLSSNCSIHTDEVTEFHLSRCSHTAGKYQALTGCFTSRTHSPTNTRPHPHNPITGSSGDATWDSHRALEARSDQAVRTLCLRSWAEDPGTDVMLTLMETPLVPERTLHSVNFGGSVEFSVFLSVSFASRARRTMFVC